MKYGINQPGADALNQLAQDMSRLNSDIEENGTALKSKIAGLEEDLGIYGEQILDLVGSVNTTQEKGRESVELLTSEVKKLADQVQELVNLGLC